MSYLFSPQAQITVKVINGLYPGVTTVELDNLAAETCATMATKHPDFQVTPTTQRHVPSQHRWVTPGNYSWLVGI